MYHVTKVFVNINVLVVYHLFLTIYTSTVLGNFHLSLSLLETFWIIVSFFFSENTYFNLTFATITTAG